MTFWNGDEPRKRRDAGSNTDATALEHGSNTVDTFQAKPSRALPNENKHTPTRARGTSVPTVKDVQGHAVTIGLAPAEAQNFFDYYEQRGWTDRNGQPVRNWQAALRRWKVTAQERKSRSKALQTPVEADYRNPNDPLLGKSKPA